MSVSGSDNSPRVRVVALSRQGSLRVVAGLELVTCISAYEAAAEILAAPASALVVDLGDLLPRHMGLLDLARRRGLEMFAFGSGQLPLSAEDLNGLRLVSLSELPMALECLLPSPPARPAELDPPGKCAEATLAPAKSQPDELVEIDSLQVAVQWNAPPPQPDTPQARPELPSALLSPEELSALLEDQE